MGAGLHSWRRLASPLRRLLMPVWEYVLGLLWYWPGRAADVHPGPPYPHGVWFYYPVLLVLKSPLGFLALLALGWPLATGQTETGEAARPIRLRRRCTGACCGSR